MAYLELVTVLYNSNGMLDDFFKSLSAQSFQDYHLFLIDNSASAETDEIIRTTAAKYPAFAYTHIKNSENTGVAAGNNTGIQLALRRGAAYVCLLNNDIDFDNPDLLADMVNHAKQNQENIIVPKIFFYGTRKIWLADGRFIHYKGTSEVPSTGEDDSARFSEAKYIGYAPTCFMLISRNVFEKIGLMDEYYFVYYDDNDFILRAVRNGFRIWYMPSLEVFHKESVSTGGDESPFSIFYLTRNRVYLIRKLYHFPLKQIALTHAVVGQTVKSLRYDRNKRKLIYKALKQGFKTSLPSTEKYL